VPTNLDIYVFIIDSVPLLFVKNTEKYIVKVYRSLIYNRIIKTYILIHISINFQSLYWIPQLHYSVVLLDLSNVPNN